MSKLVIRKSKKNDYAALKQIAEAKLGSDFAGEDEFYDVDISLVAELDGEIAGFGTAGIITAEDEPQLDIHLSEKTGMLYSVAVSDQFERRGIASALAKERINRLWDMGCDSIVATAWESEGTIHVGKILFREGFEIVEKIPGFWVNYNCVRCGDKCECTAVIFKLERGS